ncbi:MAG: UDP-glucose 4-epimerase GalE, partial [Alphaproteobacteria bacterium]
IQRTEKIIGRTLAYQMAARRAGDPAVLIASSDKAKQILGWQPHHSDLEHIIRSTWKMYQK